MITDDDHEHGHGHEEDEKNMNMTAASLHVIGDMLSSVGVIIASIIIYVWPNMWFMDPICTYIFAIMVTCTTIPVFKKLLNVMMEATPEVIATWKGADGKSKTPLELKITDLKKDILNVD